MVLALAYLLCFIQSALHRYEIQPDEIYNLDPQSPFKVSFDVAEYISDVDGMGVLSFFEAIRACKLSCKLKFYQASLSELYGKVREIPQNEYLE
ncbi:unnamed protein product [Dimorphilus gyrociliatus]|uniref:GDP-D-mannose dehydratase n=1 Tax=Dimorphilus gyrociliatus TaxID=2664684 RepID=A0A7I8WEU0_9ANNE|nr:unnamed protein product [Dimorphilus gyrociliatus]